MENTNDDLDISTQETEESFSDESFEYEEVEESVEDIKARLAKAEELAKNYKIRAEKAEKKTKEESPKLEAKKDELSSLDLYALMGAKVPQEDISEVKEYAQMKGISISDALKSTVVRTILKDKEEMRNVAEATNTGSARRVSHKVSDESLIEDARKGKIPESDEDIMRLIKAHKRN